MRYAHYMVWQLGMGKSGLIGDFHYLISPNGQSMISEKTKEMLDNDTQEILQSCLKEVTDLLKDKIDLLETFAQELIKKEELEYDEIEDIFKQFGVTPLSRNQSQN